MDFKLLEQLQKKQELIVIPCYEETPSNIAQESFKKIKMDFKAKRKESILYYDNESRLLFVGLGKKDNLELETLRKITSPIIQTCQKLKITSCAIHVPKTTITPEETIQALVEGLMLSDYEFDHYITQEDNKKTRLKEVTFVVPSVTQKLKDTVQTAQVITHNACLARDLVNLSSYHANPESITKLAKQIKGLSCTVIDHKKAEKLNMGLLLAVGQGSTYTPRLAILEYKGNPKSNETIALVGKGITFDSGGYNIKPTGFMETMKTDMHGSATVLYTIKALSELKIKKNIVAVLALAENMVSSHAYKPGDVFNSHQGLTVEVTNTDAEGRLVLADALSYVTKKYKPSQVIDVATLTGAASIALGKTVTATITNNEQMYTKLVTASKNTGEKVWQLPLYEEHKELLKSDIADIRNHHMEPQAGTIVGGAFLEKFINDTPWIHLDIGGTGRSDKPVDYISKGATGVGVRLLCTYILSD